MDKKKIFILDDESSICDTVKTYLEEAGPYEVHTQIHAKKALEDIKTLKPDLMILDEVMPEASGSDVLDKIRQEEGFQDTPVLFLTGILSKTEASQEGGVIAGNVFLAKPLVLEELMHFVKKYLEKSV